MKLLTKNRAKKAIGMVLAATMAFSVASASVLATSDATIFPVPTTTMTVDDSIMTTMSQRAATEIPLVFGLNVVGGNMFTGTIDMGGTSVNTSPDPYVWNYNLVAGDSSMADAAVSAGGYYNDTLGSIGNTGLVNADGLYSSGGGNQVYAGSTDATKAYKTYYYKDGQQVLDVGFAVGERTDVIVGFNSALLTQIAAVRANGGEDGDSTYNPLIIDVQTGSATSRLYAWSEMGEAISSYISETSGNATRYTDAATISQSIEDFSAGIPYYIASLIASEDLTKKTMAYVTAVALDEDEDIYQYTCADPSTLGNVTADVFAEVNNFNYVAAGTYTAEGLKNAGMDVMVLSTTGYSYTSSSTSQGSQTATLSKAEVLAELKSAGYSSSSMPIVMDNGSFNITIGNNGYNYSPITCMFIPYVQAYAYMDQLEDVNEYINPMAMIQYMVENFFHVSSSSSQSVAQYYVGTKWDSVDSTLDTVPSTTSYDYDTSEIEAAIAAGKTYAASTAATTNGNLLLGAYRESDNAYKILHDNSFYVSAATENTVTVKINGSTYYVDLDLVAENSDYASIAEYYAGSDNYGLSLKQTLQNYADHMDAHVWGN